MILKKNFDLSKVFWNIRYEMGITLGVTLAIYVMYNFLHDYFVLPTLPFRIAAIFIAFRNQSVYGRWWEARTIWGGSQSVLVSKQMRPKAVVVILIFNF